MKAVIISYDLVKIEKFQSDNYKVVIVDESHYLKNSSSQRSKLVCPIASTNLTVLV